MRNVHTPDVTFDNGLLAHFSIPVLDDGFDFGAETDEVLEQSDVLSFSHRHPDFE